MGRNTVILLLTVLVALFIVYRVNTNKYPHQNQNKIVAMEAASIGEKQDDSEQEEIDEETEEVEEVI